MSTKTTLALQRMFDRHRIVFWYDESQELREEFEALILDKVCKLEIQDNEFSLKYRMLLQEPEQRFLVYKSSAAPAPMENWLLDVQLSHGEYRADRLSNLLAELELGPEYREMLQGHEAFFNAKRLEQFRTRLHAGDGLPELRWKMLATCCGTQVEARWDTVLESLLQEHAQEKEERWQQIEKSALAPFYWEQLKRVLGYTCETPSIADLALELFHASYGRSLSDEKISLRPESSVFLNRWKDSISHRSAFETLSAKAAQMLDIEKDLQKRSLQELGGVDLFELIDRKILSDLVRQLEARTIGTEACLHIIRQRRTGHWYAQFTDLYSALENAALFFQALHEMDLHCENLADGFSKYTSSWYKIDQYYRKFGAYSRKASQAMLVNLGKQVDNFYSNHYVKPLGDQWQTHLDKASGWFIDGVLSQRNFYSREVKEYLQKDKKIVVIISDAMRYEVGEELLRKLSQESGYKVDLRAMQSTLPSYTSLGMSALLPHQELQILEDESGDVLVDGMPSKGTQNRSKILAKAVPQGAIAIQSEDFINLGPEDRRVLMRDHSVLYVYHNQIDAAGDKRDTESRVFEETDNTIDKMVTLVKKLVSANANNLLITADHGFLYQNNDLDDSDFSALDIQDNGILYRNRRFLLGKGMQSHSAMQAFSASQLKLQGSIEVQVPRSINRLRLKGSGSRFVHGGAALQEIVIPLLSINKARKDDLRNVEIEIMRGSTSIISAGQLSVVFFQDEPVGDKVLGRSLRAGIYAENDELLSDIHELQFDSASTNARDREQAVRFLLAASADRFNNQEVTLRLEERAGKTTKYTTYKTLRYTLRRSFTSDFDF